MSVIYLQCILFPVMDDCKEHKHNTFQYTLLLCTYCTVGVEGARLVPWAGSPPDASFRLYLREAFQSQTHTEKVLYNESR